MKKILPIETDLPINIYIAHWFSILFAGGVKHPEYLLFDRIVQLQIELLPTQGSIAQVTFFNPMDTFLEPFDTQTVNEEDLVSLDVIEQIKNALLDGYYLLTLLNEFFIPGTIHYQLGYVIHPQIIYGFDDEEMCFYAMCHRKDRTFGLIKISFPDFLISFKDRTDAYAFIKIRCKKGFNAKIMEPLMHDLLYDYIHAENRFQKTTAQKAVFGMGVYDVLCRNLLENSEWIDTRDFSVLLSHKQIMLRRIREHLHMEQLANEYEEVTRLALLCRNASLKFERVRKQTAKQYILNNLETMKKLEIDILSRVYANIQKPCKKFTLLDKKKSTKLLSYNLDTKVGELVKDNRVWDIIEEYVPGAQSNTLLPFIYGMRLKNLVGKGDILDITAEQEQEILERIFALSLEL